VARYERLYQLYRAAYFALGSNNAKPAALGNLLPELRLIAEEARRASH
jgi:L-ribulokinase